MPVNTFEIYKNNIIKCDSHGNGQIVFSATDFPIPPGTITGLPDNVDSLVNLVGPNNIAISCYAAAKGSVADHDCEATWTLYVSGYLKDGTPISTTGIVSSSDDLDSGGPINTPWVPILSNGSSSPGIIKTMTQCSGSGCWCGFFIYGGWSNAVVSLKLVVTINLVNFCTTMGQNNIKSDLCYNFISDYINNQSFGPTQEISSYLKDYCARNYPNGNLSLFNVGSNMDPRDYYICACNMPDQDYKEFLQSISGQFSSLDLGSIAPNCLLPACKTSPFKGIQLDNCPVPECLLITNVNDSNISGPVTINQNANCSKIGIKSPNSNSNANGPQSRTRKIIDKIKGVKWWVWMIVAIIIIIIIITIVLIVMNSRKNKNLFEV